MRKEKGKVEGGRERENYVESRNADHQRTHQLIDKPTDTAKRQTSKLSIPTSFWNRLTELTGHRSYMGSHIQTSTEHIHGEAPARYPPPASRLPLHTGAERESARTRAGRFQNRHTPNTTPAPSRCTLIFAAIRYSALVVAVAPAATIVNVDTSSSSSSTYKNTYSSCSLSLLLHPSFLSLACGADRGRGQARANRALGEAELSSEGATIGRPPIDRQHRHTAHTMNTHRLTNRPMLHSPTRHKQQPNSYGCAASTAAGW